MQLEKVRNTREFWAGRSSSHLVSGWEKLLHQSFFMCLESVELEGLRGNIAAHAPDGICVFYLALFSH